MPTNHAVAKSLQAETAMIFAAHPDDEVLALGGHPEVLRKCIVVHITDGAPRAMPDRAAHSARRRNELHAALALAGMPAYRTIALGVIDQETIRGLTEVTLSIERLIAAIRPATIFTHPYEGGHPDHDATAFAVAMAAERASGARAPTILEFTSYHNGTSVSPVSTLRVGEFLRNSDTLIHEVPLSAERAARKNAMLAFFTSQQHMICHFPVGIERFRFAPKYDFSAAPHEGTLYYEDQPWGITGRQWRRMAAEASAELAAIKPEAGI